MSKTQEALKLALEALKMCRGLIRNNIENLVSIASPNPWFSQDVDHAITAIREALAEQPAQHERVQPDSECKEDDGCPTEKAVLQRFWRKAQQQEPVAWRTFDGEGGYDYRTYDMNENYAKEWDKQNPKHKGWVEPLYTSPPASKPWAGLTDEEIDECYYWKDRQWTTDELVRHVEAKLREKNT